jgi:hypothetical protein
MVQLARLQAPLYPRQQIWNPWMHAHAIVLYCTVRPRYRQVINFELVGYFNPFNPF